MFRGVLQPHVVGERRPMSPEKPGQDVRLHSSPGLNTLTRRFTKQADRFFTASCLISLRYEKIWHRDTDDQDN